MANVSEANEVDIYNNGQYRMTVQYKHKWQALLFHWLLNQSEYAAGVRNY